MKVGLSVAAVGTASLGYLYHKHVHRGEPSRPLGRLLGHYITHLTSTHTTIHSARLAHQNNGLVVVCSGVAVWRDDGYKAVLGHDNYTRFHLQLDSVTARLDLRRWVWEGESPVVRCDIVGVRGDVDKSHLVAVTGWRQPHRVGEVNLSDGLFVKDLLVNYRTTANSVFPVSIYTADVPRLRWSWLLHDLLYSNTIIGSYDNSLFTFHSPQTPNSAMQRQLRVDSLNIDHVTVNAVSGPLTWIQRGRLAIDILVTLPGGQFGEDVMLTNFFKALHHRLTTTTTTQPTRASDTVQFHVDLRLSGVKAQVPLITTDLSLYDQAIVRPTVAYLNEHRHHTIPLSFTFSLDRIKDLQGAWGLTESGLSDNLARGVSESFAELAKDKQKAPERMRRVGLWSVYSLFRQLLQS